MEIHSLEDAFVYELQGALYMERELVDSLEEMAANATNGRISKGFDEHRDETVDHVRRVEEAFEAMGRTPEERPCAVVEALNEERYAFEERVADEDLLNTFYLGAGMKTERIELTTYESVLMQADRLGLGTDVTDPLEENRDNEELTFDRLQAMATASELKSLWDRLLP